jgi:hypothetical protein
LPASVTLVAAIEILYLQYLERWFIIRFEKSKATVVDSNAQQWLFV